VNRFTRRTAIGAALLAGILPKSARAQQPREGTLKVGDPAPPFALQGLKPDTEIKLEALKGKPVVLVFGSCT
jgi:hypothetical protein